MEGTGEGDRQVVRAGEAAWSKKGNMDRALGKSHPDSEQHHDDLTSGPTFGARHVMTFWAFLGFLVLFSLRVNMTITLVAMASQNATQPLANSSDCPQDHSLKPTSTVKADFQWSNTLQGFILSAFYYGYFVTQIPGSFMANRLGGKLMFAVAMIGCSALALLTPLCARIHPALLIATRVVQGGLQGIVFPSMQVMLSRWVPTKERSRLVAFTYAGCQAGTVLGVLGAGYLNDTSLGWPGVFYVEGVLGLAWCVGWQVFTSDSPLKHPRITEDERNYILINVANSHLKAPSPPWGSIVRSPAIYGIAGAHFANDWGCFAIMTCLPQFMKDVLSYDLSQNGFLSSLPYLMMWVANIVAGTLADFLRKPNRLKTVHVRKLMVTIGLVGPATLLLLAAYLPSCGRVLPVTLLSLAMGLSGFTIAGHSVNHLDIAPVFAGLLFAMTNSFGTTSGWIGPALAGVLTEHNDPRHGWQTFFLVSAAIYASGGSLFILLARGEVQPWAVSSDTETLVTPSSPTYGSTQASEDDPHDVTK